MYTFPEVPENMPKALFSNVIVDVSHAAAKEKVSEGGIVLQATTTEKIPTDGIVISVGPDCKVIEVGNRVVLPLNTGAMKHFDWQEKPKDKKYAVMDEKSIPAVF